MLIYFNLKTAHITMHSLDGTLNPGDKLSDQHAFPGLTPSALPFSLSVFSCETLSGPLLHC